MSNKELEIKAQEHDMTDVTPEAVAEAAVATEKVIENAVVSGYKKIEDAVVGGYKKIENGVVSGFEKVTDKCVEKLFAREGESVEDAKKRLAGSDETV